MVKLLSWNCHRAARKSFVRQARDLISSHSPTILIIVEPRISGRKAERVVAKLGFDSWVCSDSEGYAGGVWVLWRNDSIQLDIFGVSTQAICAFARSGLSETWLLTAVYASPNAAIRWQLWKAFEELDLLVNVPWLMVGDLNDVLLSTERKGGNALCLARRKKFADMVNNRKLIDMGFADPQFT